MTLAATPAPVNRALALPGSETQTSPDLSPLEGASPDVRAVFELVLFRHALTPPDQLRRHDGAPADLLCYASHRDLDAAQAFLRQGFSSRDAATAILHVLQERMAQGAGAIPADPLAAPGKRFGDPYSRKERTQKRGEYETWRRRRMLAEVAEHPGAPLEELALRAGYKSEKYARLALRWLVRNGWVTGSASGSSQLLPAGSAHLELMREELSGTFGHFKTMRRLEGQAIRQGRAPLSLVLEIAQKVVNGLRSRGWYEEPIHEALKAHSVSYILSLLQNTALHKRARSAGAVLYAILMRPEQTNRKRASAVVESVLAQAGSAIRSACKALIEQYRMAFQDARRLACSLRKRLRTGLELTVGDVQGIAAWIARRSRPDPPPARPTPLRA